MNWNTEKQARLDAFEMRNKWPELARANFWPIDKLVAIRRASVALHNADINYCNDHDQEGAAERIRRAEQRAQLAISGLMAEFVDAFLLSGRIVSQDFVRINENGYGFRYIEVQDKYNHYTFID